MLENENSVCITLLIEVIEVTKLPAKTNIERKNLFWVTVQRITVHHGGKDREADSI